MRKLVRDLRRVPVAIGDGVKRPLADEAKPLEKMGKKLVAARALAAGHVLAEEDPRRNPPPTVASRLTSSTILIGGHSHARSRRRRPPSPRTWVSAGQAGISLTFTRRLRGRHHPVKQPSGDELRALGLVVFDFDGVFIDLGVWVSETGEERSVSSCLEAVGPPGLPPMPGRSRSTSPMGARAARRPRLRPRTLRRGLARTNRLRATASAARAVGARE